MVLSPQYLTHEGPEKESQHVYHIACLRRAYPVVEEEVFDNTANDVSFVPVDPTPIPNGLGPSMVKEDETRSIASGGVGREVARDRRV